MASEVSVCSNALLMLGARPINSFDDAGDPGGLDRARIANNLWPSVRDALLRSHPWNCAVKRVVLSPSAAAPAFGYSHKFAMPGDWLRTLDINDTVPERYDFRLESGFILVDTSVLNLRYIYKNTDVGKWDSMLVRAAELAMAAEMAYAITKSASKEELQQKKFELFMRQARAVDGQDETPATLGDFPLLSSRYR